MENVCPRQTFVLHIPGCVSLAMHTTKRMQRNELIFFYIELELCAFICMGFALVQKYFFAGFNAPSGLFFHLRTKRNSQCPQAQLYNKCHFQCMKYERCLRFSSLGIFILLVYLLIVIYKHTMFTFVFTIFNAVTTPSFFLLSHSFSFAYPFSLLQWLNALYSFFFFFTLALVAK